MVDVTEAGAGFEGELWEAERELLDAVMRGKRAHLRGQKIRGAFVRELALEIRDDWPLQPAGVHINDAKIEGDINLEGSSVQRPLLLFRCEIGDAVSPVPTLQLRDSRLKRFGLYQCALHGRLNADRVVIEGAAFIQATQITGRLRLRGADIQGSLSLEETVIRGDDISVVLDHASIDGPLLLRNSEFGGELRMPGARIQGGVLAENVKLLAASGAGAAAIADGVQVDGPWVMSDAQVAGKLQLRGAELKGLLLQGSKFTGAKNAILAEGIRVEGDLAMPNTTLDGEIVLTNGRILGRFNADRCVVHAERHALTAGGLYVRQGCNLNECKFSGSVRFDGAEIGKTFFANNIEISVQGQALTANVIKVGGDWIMRSAKIHGSIRIPGADIVGQLALTSSNIHGSPLAIRADGAKILGGWFMGRARIQGRVRLPAAYIGNQLRFRGSQFSVHAGPAIVTNGSTIKRDLMLNGGFKSNGGISLDQTVIGGDVDLSDSQIKSNLVCREGRDLERWDDDDLVERYDRMALSFVDAQISRLIMPSGEEHRPQGIVDLSRAHVGTLEDYASAWPPSLSHGRRKSLKRKTDEQGNDVDHLILDGFDYEHMEHPSGLPGAASVRASEKRISWLAGQTEADLFQNFKPQSWVHLSKRLSAQGFHEDAREVSIARRRWHRRSSSVRRRSQIQSWLLDVFALFGFNPWRTVLWITFFVLFFAGIWLAAAQHCSAPGCSDERVFVRSEYGRFSSDPAIRERTYPEFLPLAYSFDLFVPVISFGYQEYWRPNLRFGPITKLRLKDYWAQAPDYVIRLTWGGVLYVLYIFEMILGLVLTSLAVTGFTGMLRRDE